MLSIINILHQLKNIKEINIIVNLLNKKKDNSKLQKNFNQEPSYKSYNSKIIIKAIAKVVVMVLASFRTKRTAQSKLSVIQNNKKIPISRYKLQTSTNKIKQGN